MLFLSIGKNVSNVTGERRATILAAVGFLQNLAEPTNSSLLRLHGSWGYETAPKKSYQDPT